MLEARDISCGYGAVQVLFGLSVHLGQGETVAVCGPNGVGKSTLIRVLSGLMAPSAGSVRLGQREVTSASAERRVRMGLGTVIGQAAFGSLTVEENVRMHGYPMSLKKRDLRDRVDRSLAVFPRLQERRDQPASTLSGGERQMLALARALVARPDVLLIDELSLGLAPVVVTGLVELVRRLSRLGTSILVVEQSVHVAAALADRLYFMEKGAIAAEHTSAELAAHPELAQSLMLGGHAS